MIKKLILAAFSGAVTQFLLGWILYGFLLAGFMKANTQEYPGFMKEMDSGWFMVMMFASNLSMAFLMAYLFQRWAKFETFLRGLTGGMFIGFFFSLSYNLSFYSMSNLYNEKALIVDVLSSTFILGIMGAVIGWVLGLQKE